MRRTLLKISALQVLALGALCSLSGPALAQTKSSSGPGMAPLELYLMADRNSEIALARSAAPETISRDATILVLIRTQYGIHGPGRQVVRRAPGVGHVDVGRVCQF